jgi:Leucine-rich repeat (LRR) protein
MARAKSLCHVYPSPLAPDPQLLPDSPHTLVTSDAPWTLHSYPTCPALPRLPTGALSEDTCALEDICGLITLTELASSGFTVEELPHNISTLTKLKILILELVNLKRLPAEIAWFLQLQELYLWDLQILELPRSFTQRAAFPALIKLYIRECSKLVVFHEVDEGALPKLRTLDFTGSDSLETLPLSLEALTSLKKLILSECLDILKGVCRKNCEKSSIWRMLHIQYS